MPSSLPKPAAVAGALRERGVGPGDRVALALPSMALVPALHGCLLLGAVAVPIDLRLRPDERAARQSGSRLVLESPVAGDPISDAYDHAPSDIATLMFTSGTTAGPKPVELSYDNWLWNALGSALALGLDPRERWLCPMPLAHVGGLSIQLRSAVYATTVVAPRPLRRRARTGCADGSRRPGDARLARSDDARTPARCRPARTADPAPGAAGGRPDRARPARRAPPRPAFPSRRRSA